MLTEFQILRLDGETGLKVVGELDVATTPQLRAAFQGAVFADQPVLDLSELTFVDSCGIRAILELARTQNGNGPVIIVNPSHAVSRVFDIIGIDQHAGVELRRTDVRGSVLQASS